MGQSLGLNFFCRGNLRALALIGAAVAALPAISFAQTDEIQVYDASIAEPGVFNLMVHNNFTPSGQKTPAFPGAIISDRSLNGAAEWAYGVTDWFEQGLYLPLYSVSTNHGATLNGFKLRELFVRPHSANYTFFYGVNFEFSYNARYWETKRLTSEVRPILGWHLRRVDIILNPILDTNYTGLKNLDFAPATRLAYKLSPKWTMAAEEYADFGPLHQFLPARQQHHMLYAVVDRAGKSLDVEVGVGVGLTPGTDKVTLKLMLSRNLNHPSRLKRHPPDSGAGPTVSE